MNALTQSMGGVVKSMDNVMQSMDAERISAVMDKFERQFEDLDISTQFMENSMQQSTAMTMPETEVDGLMHQVADEHGLEFESELTQIGGGKKTVAAPEERKMTEEDELEARFKKLQGL
jgi:charged multivesicular body protein 1